MKFILKTSDYAILKHDSNDVFTFKKSVATTLSFEELDTIEGIVQRAVKNYNIKELKNAKENPYFAPYRFLENEEYLIDPSGYKRQYIPVIRENGDKVVWVNFFCDCEGFEEPGKEYWRNEIVIVMDGGNCFFNMYINLTKNRYYGFCVNGWA